MNTDKKTRWIIGIDPDTVKSGVVMLDTEKKVFLSIDSLEFSEIVELFTKTLPEYGYTREELKVVVEDSWSDGSHIFRTQEGYGTKKNTRLAYDVGRCHQVGQMIIQLGKAFGLNIEGKKALRKTWSGKDHKITQEEIAYFIPCWPTRANQEERDAALLAWDEARLPVKVRAASMVESVRVLTRGRKAKKAFEIPDSKVTKTTDEARETLRKILKMES